jgi:NMD protein affecting ribosome stability and mRNA decay
MHQITLSRLETKICPKCKMGMKIESIIDNTVTYFCPICLKEYRFMVCLNCGILFDENEYKLCERCNKEALEKIIQRGEKQSTIEIHGEDVSPLIRNEM